MYILGIESSCDDTCASQPGAVQQTGAENNFLSKEVEEAFNQLGVPVREGKEVAVDAIFDSVSVATTYREKLAEQGIIFCSFGEAIHDHPELVKKYIGTVVPSNDNFFAALNAAVASDGTCTITRMIGSSSTGAQLGMPSLMPMRPAVWKAASEESTV